MKQNKIFRMIRIYCWNADLAPACRN